MINLDYMDMMSDGDADMKKVMLEMLMEEIPQELQRMREAHASADWNGLASVSHKMKSTLAFVGNDAMTSANKELESIGKTQDGTDRYFGNKQHTRFARIKESIRWSVIAILIFVKSRILSVAEMKCTKLGEGQYITAYTSPYFFNKFQG
jgi:HPt (histidine-containing phosphotransfer) domain-containing protein